MSCEWVIVMDVGIVHYKFPPQMAVRLTTVHPELPIISIRFKYVITVELTVFWDTNIPS